MKDFFDVFRGQPVMFMIFIAGIIGAIFAIGPMMKIKKIGNVACDKCGHVGKLKQTMTNKLVCADCGSDDWKPVSEANS